MSRVRSSLLPACVLALGLLVAAVQAQTTYNLNKSQYVRITPQPADGWRDATGAVGPASCQGTVIVESWQPQRIVRTGGGLTAATIINVAGCSMDDGGITVDNTCTYAYVFCGGGGNINGYVLRADLTTGAVTNVGTGYYPALDSANQLFVSRGPQIAGRGLNGGGAQYLITPITSNTNAAVYVRGMTFDPVSGNLIFYSSGQGWYKLTAAQVAQAGTVTATFLGTTPFEGFHSVSIIGSRIYFAPYKGGTLMRMSLDTSQQERFNVDVSGDAGGSYIKGFGVDYGSTNGDLLFVIGPNGGPCSVYRVLMREFVVAGASAGSQQYGSAAVAYNPSVAPTVVSTFTVTCTGSVSGARPALAYSFPAGSVQPVSFTLLPLVQTESITCKASVVSGDPLLLPPPVITFTLSSSCSALVLPTAPAGSTLSVAYSSPAKVSGSTATISVSCAAADTRAQAPATSTCAYTAGGFSSWTSYVAPTCTQILCSTLPVSAPYTATYAGAATINSIGSTATISITCAVGFAPSGTGSSTCSQSVANGNAVWSSPQLPTCVPMVCPLIPAAPGVTVTYPNGRGVGSSARLLVTCTAADSVASAPVDVLCLATSGSVGVWAAYEAPTCTTITCDSIVLAEGLSATFAGGAADNSVGSVATIAIACVPGQSVPSGTGSSTCAQSVAHGAAAWSTPVLPTCVPIVCPEFDAGSDISVAYPTGRTVGNSATLTVSCPAADSLASAPVSVLCSAPDSTTSSVGVWAAYEAPTCTTITCDSIVLAEGLSATFAGGAADNSVGSVATIAITCAAGYVPSGTSSVSCAQAAAHGPAAWGVPAALTCIALPCPQLSAPSNGFVTNGGQGSTGSSVQFSCDGAFTLTGASSLWMCGTNSQWSAASGTTLPTCVRTPTPCPTVSAPTNGAVTNGGAGRAGDSITFSCLPGFALSGAAPTFTCQWSRAWQSVSGSTFPTCVAVPHCAQRDYPVAPVGGFLSVTSTPSGATFVFRCNDGRDPVGQHDTYKIHKQTCKVTPADRSPHPYPTCRQ